MDAALPPTSYVAAVADQRNPGVVLGRLLAAAENAAPVDAADAVGAELRQMLGVSAVAFLVADLSGKALIRLGHASSPAAARTQGRETAEVVPLAGTAHGRALERQDVQVEGDGDGDGWMLYAPVTNRGEAIGVLEVELAREPDADCVAAVALAAHALAYIVVANRRFTDLFEWGQRSVPLSVAAEIQHRLLPAAYTCEAGQFTLAGWLEPAASVGGDTFDYALDRHSLQISITDAVGHQVEAALLATLFVGALRNARRKGLELLDQAGSANEALLEHASSGQFVTGQLARFDLLTGAAVILNAGHPFPLRLRAGRVEEIALAVQPPFGVVAGQTFVLRRLPLEPGDRLVFLTDGMQERNAASLDVAQALLDTARLHPREVVHAMGDAVLTATGGNLRDDATLVCLDWYGGPPRRRASEYGSDPDLASAAREPGDA